MKGFMSFVVGGLIYLKVVWVEVFCRLCKLHKDMRDAHTPLTYALSSVYLNLMSLDLGISQVIVPRHVVSHKEHAHQ